jgi:threonine dehydrogenase-like Zn-dependent dehydrogenase
MNAPGVFAEYVAIPAAFAHRVPDEVSAADAVGIEPLAVALHACDLARIVAGELVAVVGCGAEGLLLIQLALARGARVLAIDIHDDRLAAAVQLGAQHTALAGSPVAIEPDVVLESAGAASALELAMGLAAPGGRIVALGLGADAVTVEPFRFVRRGLTLVGSLIYDHPTDFQRAIDLINQAEVRPSSLAATVLRGLDAIPDALADSQRHGKLIISVAASAR